MADANVKILSYNIHSCVGTDGLYSLDRVATIIGEGEAHIVCLQEVEVNPTQLQTRIWSLHHSDDHPASIAELAGYQHHVFVPAIRSRASNRWKEEHYYADDMDVSGNFSDDQWKKKYSDEGSNEHTDYMGLFGNAILSKYPIIEIRTHRYKRYKRYKRKTLRIAMACKISLPNNSFLWIINTHLGCHFIGKEQNLQTKELVVFINSLQNSSTNCEVILCGDFNAPPLFSSIKTLRCSGFLDIWKLRGQGTGGTFPSNARVLNMPSCFTCLLKWIRLDYMFLHRNGRAVCKCVCVRDCLHCSMASDHLPLCAVIEYLPHY